MKIAFTLNREEIDMELDPGRRVVDVLREDLGLTGTKEGCGSGECGACTILVDGEPRASCLMLAVQLQGRHIMTIEGLSKDSKLHPIQKAFIECGAVQCGFCTPGMILSSFHLLEKNSSPCRKDIREAISGNLCRCTGYNKIVDAVAEAVRQAGKGDAH